MTGVPGVPFPPDWDSIPGARRCTVGSLSFRDHRTEIAEMGAAVFGLSTQETGYQREMAGRLHLPTMSVHGMTLLRRLTLMIDDSVITHVLYPVFPLDRAAADVVAWLSQNRGNIGVG